MSAAPSWRVLSAIAVFALALRMLVYSEIADTPLFQVLLGDSIGYVDWAGRITAGNWLGDDVFYQAPLYPYFLAVISEFFGPGRAAIAIVQSLLGAASCALIASATARYFSARAGIAAGILLALYPSAIFFDLIVQKASVATFLTACLFWSLSRLGAARNFGQPIVMGLLLGAMILTRENTLALLPCITLWLLLPWSGGITRVRVLRCGLFVLGTAMVLGPIGLRNWSFGDQFLITTSQLGTNLYIGNGAEAHGRYRPLIPNRGFVAHERSDAHQLAEQALGFELSPGQVSDYWVERTIREILDDPSRWARLIVHKTRLVLSAEEVPDTESLEAYADESSVLATLSFLFHFGILFPLACVGAWTTRRQWRATFPLLLIAAATFASVVAFYVMSRYRFSVAPVLMIFGGAGVSTLIHAARNRTAENAAGLIAVLAVSLFVSNFPTGVHHEPRAVTHFNVGMILLSQERYPEAQVALEKAARVSDAPKIYLRLGEVRERRGDLESALRHYEEMLIRRIANPVEVRRRIRTIRERKRTQRMPAGAHK